jgi:hypothetical protein
MKPTMKYWITKWLLLTLVMTFSFVLLLILCIFIGVPLLNWLVNDIPYSILPWVKIKRLLTMMPLLGFFSSSVLIFQKWCQR